MGATYERAGRLEDAEQYFREALKLAPDDAETLNYLGYMWAEHGLNLDEARTLHRHAQYRWDFVSAENSMGFHNPEYVLSILFESANLARQAQMKASQAAGDPSLLAVGIYYNLDPLPTPVP